MIYVATVQQNLVLFRFLVSEKHTSDIGQRHVSQVFTVMQS